MWIGWALYRVGLLVFVSLHFLLGPMVTLYIFCIPFFIYITFSLSTKKKKKKKLGVKISRGENYPSIINFILLVQSSMKSGD